MGAETADAAQKLQGSLALLLAVGSVGILLASGAFLERVLGQKGLQILSRVTALVLSALAAQMMLSGVKGFLAGS
jgi:multiple antibiotic resistance protein